MFQLEEGRPRSSPLPQWGSGDAPAKCAQLRATTAAWPLWRRIPASLGLPLTEVNSFLLSLQVLTDQ